MVLIALVIALVLAFFFYATPLALLGCVVIVLDPRLTLNLQTVARFVVGAFFGFLAGLLSALIYCSTLGTGMNWVGYSIVLISTLWGGRLPLFSVKVARDRPARPETLKLHEYKIVLKRARGGLDPTDSNWKLLR